MQIKFLGTGTSTGVPQLACNCEVCTSTNHKDARLRASVLLTQGDFNILIDCGPDFRQQALKYNINKKLDAILITHEHYDHVGGLDDIRPLGDTHIYAENRVLEAIKRVMPYCFGEALYPGVPQINLHKLTEGHNFCLSKQTITPIRIMHAKLPILGYRIGKIAYLTDVKTISDQSVQQLQGLDVLIINALQYKEHPSHITVSQALEISKRIGAKKTYLTHFSHKIGLHKDLEKTLPENIFAAYDGLEIEI